MARRPYPADPAAYAVEGGLWAAQRAGAPVVVYLDEDPAGPPAAITAATDIQHPNGDPVTAALTINAFSEMPGWLSTDDGPDSMIVTINGGPARRVYAADRIDALDARLTYLEENGGGGGGGGAVTSVAGRTGAVVLTNTDIGGLGTAATTNTGTGATNTILGNDGRLTNARTPTSHAATHAAAGSDPVTPAGIGAATSGHLHSGTYSPVGHGHEQTDVVDLDTTLAGKADTGHAHGGVYDPAGTAAAAVAAIPSGAAAGTPSLRALGTTSTTAAAGNDSRLSNARTPTAHASTHATAGSDPIAPADIGAATSSHTHSGVYQPADADLTTIAALTPSGGTVLQENGGGWAARTPTQLAATLPADQAAGTASLRTLGAGSAQAAAGNHSHGGGGGGSTIRIAEGRVTSGNISIPNSGDVWQVLDATLQFSIAAATGDRLRLFLDVLRTGGSGSGPYLDIGIIVSSSIVWAASTGTSTPAAEGLPAWYPDASFVHRSGPARRTVEAGDISGGTVTFAILLRSIASGGTVYASAGYPFSWEIQNLGAEPA